MNKRLRQVALSLFGLPFVLGISQGVYAQPPDKPDEEGCQAGINDAFTAVIDATTSCGNVSGLSGCRVNNIGDSCEFVGLNGEFFKVETSYNVVRGDNIPDGSIVWELVDGDNGELSNVGIDFAASGGATQGGACGSFYRYDVMDDAGLGFWKGRDFQNVTYFDVCSDLSPDLPPPEPEVPGVIPTCGGVDGVGVTCPGVVNNDATTSLVCNLELTDPLGFAVPFYGIKNGACCVCNRDALAECNPDVAEGEDGFGEGCPDLLPGQLPNELPPAELESWFEFSNNPKYCETVGGKRTCYRY